jgi:hypothetical protein
MEAEPGRNFQGRARMMLKRAACLIGLCLSLSGCGNQFEGGYRALVGALGPLIAIDVRGSKAVVGFIDPFRKTIMSQQTWIAEDEGEKLILTDANGKAFAFTRDASRKKLECLNCGLGTGMPKSWERFAD